MQKLLTLIAATLLLVACGDDDDAQNSQGDPDDNAQNSQGDPDDNFLNAECEAVPWCGASGANSLPLHGEDCPDDDSCYVTTECNQSLTCLDIDSYCDGSPPLCPESTVPYSIAEGPECSRDDVNCFPVEEDDCDLTIWCQQYIPPCEEYPECPDGTTEVGHEYQCPDPDEGGHCFPVEEDDCDHILWCWDDTVPCEAAPECPDGTTHVDSCDEQEPECQEVTVCDQTIYCEDEE